MTQKNRYGLGRSIPSSIKLAVRKRVGFGCVLCGSAFVDYEHFDPDFKDARTHNSAGITLLCPQHNQKRNRKQLSLETVRAADADPACLKIGFARDEYDFGSQPLAINIGSSTFINCRHLVEINGFPILSMLGPEEAGAAWRLSGYFADPTGQVTLVIRDNEWRVGADNWDCETVGAVTTIRRGPRDIALSIKSVPPCRLEILELNMEFEGCAIRVKNGRLEIGMQGAGYAEFETCKLENIFAGIVISTVERGR